MRTAIVEQTIDPAALLHEIAQPRFGATVLFLGTVRDMNDGAEVERLDYTAYTAMAERELASIAGEALQRWPEADVIVEHRLGLLALGDVSVAIAAAHPHRDVAYEASRFVIEELKRRLPIWKREHYADGRAEWVAGSPAAGARPA